MTMDDQYPRLFVEGLLARKQLAQTFESAAASEFSPVNDLTLGTAPPKNAGKDETSIRDRVSKIEADREIQVANPPLFPPPPVIRRLFLWILLQNPSD